MRTLTPVIGRMAGALLETGGGRHSRRLIRPGAILLSLLGLMLLITGCRGPAAKPAAFTCADSSGAARAAVGLIDAHPAQASSIFVAILSSGGSSQTDRDCAAEGLAYLANQPSGDNWAQTGAGNWNTFYAGWVAPVARFGIPWLVVFVLLLGLSRVLTRCVAPTVMSFPDRTRASVGYWSGMSGLLLGAGLLTLGLAALPWTLGAQIVGLVVWWVWLIWVSCNAWLHSNSAFWNLRGAVAARGLIIVVIIIGGATTAYQTRGGPSVISLLVPAATLIAVSAWQVAVVRGLNLGLLIDGRKADGAPDSGTAQQIVQRFYAMGGTNRPRGLLVPNTADIDPLPAGAINLLPNGSVLQAVMTYLVRLFAPSTPWRATVSQIDDRSVELVLTRNGRSVTEQVITAASLGLRPPPSGQPPSGPTHDQSASPPVPSAADLITATAADVLWHMAQTHPVLRESLEPLTRWESLAAQAIALSGDRPLDTPTRNQLLAIAVDLDVNNWSAAQALAVSVDDRLSEAGGTRIAAALDQVVKAAQPYGKPKSGPRPVQIRAEFNRAVVLANVGLERVLKAQAKVTPEKTLLDVDQPRPVKISDDDLSGAGEAVEEVDKLIRTARAAAAESPTDDPGLAAFLTGIDNAALYGRAALIGLTGEPAWADGRQPADAIAAAPASALGHVEQICAAAVLGVWPLVLTSLRRLLLMAPERVAWARSDPFLTGVLRAARRNLDPPGQPGFARTIRSLVFDPVPAHFFDLAVFSPAESTALTKAGVFTAEALLALPTHWRKSLANTLGVTAARAGYLRKIAELANFLGVNADDADVSATARGRLLLLVAAGVTSIDVLRSALRAEPDDTKVQLGWEAAGGTWQATLPSEKQINQWRNRLGR